MNVYRCDGKPHLKGNHRAEFEIGSCPLHFPFAQNKATFRLQEGNLIRIRLLSDKKSAHRLQKHDSSANIVTRWNLLRVKKRCLIDLSFIFIKVMKLQVLPQLWVR